MSRFLHRPFIQSALNRGRSVEQFLPFGESNGEQTVRWLELRQQADGTVLLLLNEAVDVGNPDYLDIYSFPAVHESDELTTQRHAFESVDEAVAAAASLYQADPEKFVNSGVTQDEYGEARKWL